MDIRPGIADVIFKIPEGQFLIVTSGGLHHIQRPGQLIPKLFKRIQVALEIFDIVELKSRLLDEMASDQLTGDGDRNFKKRFVEFLEERKKAHLAKFNEIS